MSSPKKAKLLPTELVQIAALRSHPRNYQKHPDDQLDHLIESIKSNGVYRNVVVARDNTILAGHGVVAAATKMGMREIPIVRLDLDPEDPRALKVLAGDNEVRHLAEIDDRALSDLLKEISESADLMGTGFDEKMLANLVYVTRPASEIASFDEAQQWVGMPEFERSPRANHVIVSFKTKEDRDDFARRLGVELGEKTKSIWWPPRDREDPSSLRFEG